MATENTQQKVQKKFFSWFEIERMCHTISKNILNDMVQHRKDNSTRKLNYDCIVSVGRGGIIPSRIIAEDFEIKTIHVFNCHSYFGINQRGKIIGEHPIDFKQLENKNVLIVDDIFTTGNTIDFVTTALLSECENISFDVVTLFYNTSCTNPRKLTPDFFAETYDSKKNWLVLPWEYDVERDQHRAVLDRQDKVKMVQVDYTIFDDKKMNNDLKIVPATDVDTDQWNDLSTPLPWDEMSSLMAACGMRY